jgi:hypothetical protein
MFTVRGMSPDHCLSIAQTDGQFKANPIHEGESTVYSGALPGTGPKALSSDKK